MDKGNSDFLVMLSALSSTSNLTTTSDKPLDIVLVLDVSGSMAQGLETYTYTETYDVSGWGDGEYYGKNADGTYSQITRAGQMWDRHWQFNGQRVEPKTSAADTTEGHIQFYTRSIQSSGSKMNALKTAVNGFIDATADQNDTINDVDKQHRISIVKYADDSYISNGDTYGNDFNRDDYNYTQRLNPLTAYNSSNADDLKDGTSTMDGVNDLQAAGATSADYGMALAQRELTENGRDDAVKVVVFFTDGEPNHQSGFDASVATATIVAAQTLKNDPPQTTDDPAGFGALVYSVGVFGDANPNDTSNRFNAFMHGVSSNYPDATTYTNLGERAENSNYYKAAGSSDELNKIFEEIADDVQNAAMGSPTEVGSGDPTESGYITFTDTVGDYMKVDSFKSIVYADKQFYPAGEPEESNDGKTLTYKFTGTAGGNGHYAEGDMSDIIITVTRSGDGDAAAVQQGDTVTVKIPATLIPLRNFKVDTDAAGNTTLKVTENYPIRIAYGVSLKSGVDDLLKNPDETMQAYINANKSDDNNVAFYSNAFTRNAADGLTSSSFDPSTTNSFYNFTTATPLYTDEACTIPATEIDAAKNTYYYKRSHYVGNADGSASVKEEHIALVPGTSVLTIDSGKYVAKDPNGNCYITAGAPRLQRVNDFTKGEKVDPQTGTATNVINPVWNTGGTANYTQINVWLGNNGKLTKEMPGALSVTKNVEIPEGFTNNFANTEFDFTITLKNADGSIASGTFDAVVTNEQGEIQGDNPLEITLNDKGEYTHKLKDGQTLTIRGLSAGTTYAVTESAPTYFVQTKTGENGSITANATAAAVFTNTYNPTDAVMPTDNIKAQKDLQNRAWHEGDTFAFTLTPEGGAPLPEGTPEGQTYKTIEVTNGDVISFGSITFDTPGTYVYEIGEVIPEEGSRLPGISYPQTKYHATVQVSVDQNDPGKLVITQVLMTMDVDANGAEIDPSDSRYNVSDRIAVFTNVYDAGTIEANITGTKNYTDNSGKNPITADKFSFTATPTGDNAASAPVPTGIDAGASFSFGHTATGVINFPTLKFTSDMDGQSFSYTVKESIPVEANAGNKYTYQGMTYDPAEWIVTATVSVDPTVDPDNPDAEAVSVAWSAVSSAEGGTKTHVTFANSYTPTPAVLTGDASIRGSKTLDGRNAGTDEDFTFTITGANSATTAAMTNGTITFKNGTTATVSNAKNGVEQFFSFGDATFTKPGTYTFNINETIPGTNPGGMTYDAHTCTVTVEVVDNNGVLTATVGDYGNGAGKTTDYAAFVNTYRASLNYSTSVDLYVSKTLNGRDMAANEFSFTIAGPNGFSETASNKAAGNGVADGIKMLNGITFTQADAGKAYIYTVDEVDPETTLPGVTYDKNQYEIVVVVSDNGNGTLSTLTSVFRLSENANGEIESEELGTFDTGQKIPDGTIAFVNTYKASPVDVDVTTNVPLTKEVVGRDWLSGETFSFTAAKHSFNGSLAATELAKMPTPASSPITVNKPADNGNSADFGLGNLTFNEAGTYVYRVSEIKPDQPAAGMDYSANTAYITIKIKDNTTTGGLEVESAAVTAGSSTFTNSFSSTFNFSEAVTFQLSKTLNGRGMEQGKFSFTVKAADAASAEKIQLPAGTLSVNVPGAAGTDGTKVTMPNGGDIVFNHSADNTDSGKTFSYTFSEVIPDDATNPSVGNGETHYKDAGTAQNTTGWTKDGYTYDPSVYTLTIKPVMHTSTGKWEIITTLDKTLNGRTETVVSSVWNQNVDTNVPVTANADFVNSYATSGALPVSGTKTVSADPNPWNGGLAGFKFKIEANDDATQAAVTAKTVILPGDATSGEDGTFAFADGVKFTKEGTYSFKVTEVIPADTDKLPGIGYTNAVEGFTVEVKDDGKGNLTCTVDENRNTNLSFTNTYTATETTPFTPTIQKKVVGKDAAEGAFDFILGGADDFTNNAIRDGHVVFTSHADRALAMYASSPAITNGATETISFSDIKFTKATEGENYYTFNVTETDGGTTVDGWALDGHTYTIKVKVTDVNGQLVAEQVDKVDNSDLFTNTYGAVVTGDGVSTEGMFTKTFTGRDWTENDNFTFNITSETEGAPMPVKDGAECTQVTVNGANDTDGSQAFGFGTIAFTYDDIKDVDWGADGTRSKTFVYTVSEVIPENAADRLAGVTYSTNVATLTITLKDDGKGNVTAEELTTVARAENNVFTNRYNSNLDFDGLRGGFDIVKNLTGRLIEIDQFGFKVTAADDDSAALLGVSTNGTEYKNTTGGGYDVTVMGPRAKRDLTQDDAGKTFQYTVQEIIPATATGNYGYDDTVYTVKIAVEDDGEGNLKAITQVLDESGTAVSEQVLTNNDTTQPRPVATFNNTYTSNPIIIGERADVSINATKTFTNGVLDDGEFTFTIKDVKGNTVTTGTNDSQGHVAFNDIEYTLDKLTVDVASGVATVDKTTHFPDYVYSYSYTVSEDAVAADSGITANVGSFNIAVQVTDDADGSLSAKVIYPEGSGDNLAFANTYGAGESATLAFSGSKALVPSDDLKDSVYNLPDITGDYTFTLSGEMGAPMPGTTTANNDASGSVSFGDVTFDMSIFDGVDEELDGTRVKTFTYTVTEDGTVPGVDNDNAQTFTVTATDQGNGTMTVTSDPATGAKFAFTNVYSVDPVDSSVTANGGFKITKDYNGPDGDMALAGGEFKFVMIDADGKEAASGVNDSDGNVAMSAITFAKPGSYDYTLKEVASTNVDNGITYDVDTYKVTANVKDNSDGTLTVTWSVLDGTEDVTTDTPIIFENTYEPAATSVTFGASKKLEGGTVEDGQFEFQVRNEAGDVVATAKNNASGTVIFPAVEFTKAGTYTYTIAEVNDGQEGVTYDTTQYEATVTVTDDGQGHLSASVAYANDKDPMFVNTYTAPEEPAEPGDPEPPALPDTSDNLGPLVIGLGALAVIACAGLVIGAVKMRRKSGAHRTK